MDPLGENLETLLATGRQEILLAAPFIKKRTLARLLSKVPAGVPVHCITRWRPAEVLSGVSDLEIWPLLKEQGNACLSLKNSLHAKYYRADAHCLVGSANLTDTALGWVPQPNLELLVPVDARTPYISRFESELLQGLVVVDDQVYAHAVQVVEALRSQYPELPEPLVPDIGSSDEPPVVASEEVNIESWIPRLRNPQDLYLSYTGGEDLLGTSSREASRRDLAHLPVPPGLPRDVFNGYVGMLLLEKPIVQQVDAFVVTPQRFGAVRDYLATLPCSNDPDFNATRAWQTLMRWLRFFLPNRYALLPGTYSEVLYRVSS